jgi:hypothetical protein
MRSVEGFLKLMKGIFLYPRMLHLMPMGKSSDELRWQRKMVG